MSTISEGGMPPECLIVHDDAQARTMMVRLLRDEGFACHEAASVTGAVRLLEAHAIPLVLADCQLPDAEGVGILREVSSRWPETAVVVMADSADARVAVRCLDAGAFDVITSPFEMDVVRARLRLAMDKRRVLVENRAYRTELESRVSQQGRKYEELFLAALQSLADALEVKDAYTWGHSTRVCRYAMAIAAELGLAANLHEQLELGSRLHDIGKIGVREDVLNKDGALTPDEYAHVMEHPVIGWRLLAPLLRDMPHALSVVRSHHERFDGLGTPDGLRGHEIPLVARITAVADSFDAMTSGRVYRAGMGVDVAVAELRRCMGSQFDPSCVAAFERALEHNLFTQPEHTPAPTPRLQIVA